VSKSIGVFLVLSSLGGLGLQASVWEDPAQRTTSSWQAVYEAPKFEYGAGHRGVDLVLEAGSKISAPAAGVLYFKDLVVDREVVTVRTADGYLASFEPACTLLEVGDRVKLGQEIAWHCEPSASYEYHCISCVHFSARSTYGYISPDYLLGNLKPSVLEG
jgi:murein DD-endopeptidase MepM/ murein hydrolase activator NlpD